MWWDLFSYVCDKGRSAMLDVFLFYLIDYFVKAAIADARSEGEKRKIWLWQSFIMGVFAVVLYYVMDHDAWLMVLISIFIFFHEILRDVNFELVWKRLFQHWEDHQHHTENLTAIKNRRKQMEMIQKSHTPVSKTVISRLSDYILRRSSEKTGPGSPVYAMNPNQIDPNSLSRPPRTYLPYLQQQQRLQQTQRVPQKPPVFAMNNALTMNQNQISPVRQVNTLSQPARTDIPYTQQPNQQIQQNTVPETTSQNTPVKQPNQSWLSRPNLRRPPLKTYSQRNFPSFSQSGIKSKFMSVFGGTGKPAGLRNEGQNLCFMNCIIQCLAHTPDLLDKLVNTSSDLNCSQAESTLIDTLIHLMSECQKNNSQTGILDATPFREAASIFTHSVVASPTERQQQQDAAEFCMWLLDTLHHALNKKTNKEKRPKGSSVDTLEFIYHDLNEKRMESLKAGCREEIRAANGLDCGSYSEPIQRLADLEYLTHKRANHSAIDDMFSGQIVETRHCLAGNHLTVNMQTFNILPLPIETVRSFSGLSPLHDCFTKFCSVEHIVQECDTCLKQNSPSMTNCISRKPSSGPLHSAGMSSGDSGFRSGLHSSGCMSPIPAAEGMNDSVLHDNVFRTSTPVAGKGQVLFPARSLPKTERRCLLRQLPDTLIIQPLRYSYDQYTKQTVKVCTPISLPMVDVDLTEFIYDHVTEREDLSAGNQGHKYNLYAVCCHIGAQSTQHGHYVCYCCQHGVWYRYDDEHVTEVNMQYELTSKEIRENVYLAFYHKSSASS